MKKIAGKLFKCVVCDNYTSHRILGRWSHQSCFDYMVPLIVRKFDVHNYLQVMEILITMRKWQDDGFLNIEIHEMLMKIINQKIEMVRES